MKKKRILSFALAALLALGAVPSLLSASDAGGADGVTASPTVPLSLTDAIPENSLLPGGDFNSMSCVSNWNANTQTITWMEDDNGGFIECSGIVQNYRGFIYTPPTRVPAGKYRFTGYFRCATPGEITILRLHFNYGSQNSVFWLYPSSGEWLKVECYVELTAPLTNIKVSGGTNTILTQSYCLDNFSLVPVSSIPENAPTSFGREYSYAEVEAAALAALPEYPMYDHAAESEKYEVQGLFINQDADGFISSVGDYGCSEQDLADFARQFRDTHVTDYVIQLCNTLSTYPSEVLEDLSDKYYIRDESGNVTGFSDVNSFVGAHHVFETLDTDYIGIWCDILRENGINPWISFRMNDAHGRNEESSDLVSDYFHNNPQLRRAPDYNGVNKYWNNCYDYANKEVRDNMLAFIDEALYRYNVYGVELDFLREIFLFRPGEEEAGKAILTGFMHDVDGIIKKYEEKYGHDIKLGVRVASDVQTNLNFGLDVIGWVKADLVDMVCPSGRYSTTDNNLPVAQWKALLEGHDVVLAPCIETNIQAHPASGTSSQTFETYCASAAYYLSEGADRVYLYNYFRRIENMITDADRITTDDAKLPVSSPKQYHNIITTIGSLDKLTERNRRMIVTYNDLASPTAEAVGQLPQAVFPLPGKTIQLEQNVGRIPEGAKVTFKFSLPTDGYTKNPPTVHVNAIPCTYERLEYSSMGITTKPIYCYSVPREAWGDGLFRIKITPNEYTETDYAEIYIEAAK